jgi:hypothetical protein
MSARICSMVACHATRDHAAPRCARTDDQHVLSRDRGQDDRFDQRSPLEQPLASLRNRRTKPTKNV